MSALVDIWTSEVAKLRNKAQTVSSGGSTCTPTSTEARQKNNTNNGEEGGSSKWTHTTLLARINSQMLPYSEASVSMLVDCFSP